jgi:hypothetical protein
MNYPLVRELHSRELPGREMQGDAVKIFVAIALLGVLLSAVLVGSGTQTMATVARSFFMISTAIFACAATLGLASRSRI